MSKRTAPLAISPAIGPLPAIYVPQPGEARDTGVLWRAIARSACRAGGWATHHLRPRHAQVVSASHERSM
jgi:hypothetical protein